MKQVAALCELDRVLMHEFSQRTVRSLARHGSVRLLMPLFEKLMTANVDKELDKDRVVIEVGCAASAAGESATDVDIDALFERTRSVDQHFITKLSGLPISLRLDYRVLKPIRIQRIEHMLGFVCHLCDGWRDGEELAQAVQAAYEPAELHDVFAELLSLYARETRCVCEAAKLRGPARLAGRMLTERVVAAMQAVREEVARSVGARLFAG